VLPPGQIEERSSHIHFKKDLIPLRNLLDGVASVVLMGIAIVMLGFYLADRNRILSGSSTITIDDWQQYNEAGIRLGPEEASIVITEFMDFTCPYCRALATVTDSLQRSFPNDVAVVFQHFPLRGRPFSMDLAIAGECAAEQGGFWSMYRAIFSRPGIRIRDDLYELGEAARLPYLDAFTKCVTRPQESFRRIAEGRRIGRETGVVGTPTVWVNGRLAHARTFDALLQIAELEGSDLQRLGDGPPR